MSAAGSSGPRWRLLRNAAIIVGAAGLGALGGRVHCPGSAYLVTVDLRPWVEDLGGDLDVSIPAEDFLAALGPRALPALEEGLYHRERAVRLGAVEVLGRIDGPGVLPLLRRAARQDPDDEVRASALSELGEDPEAAPLVEAALWDRGADVRRVAAGFCPEHCRSRRALRRLAALAVSDSFLNSMWARASIREMAQGSDREMARQIRSIAARTARARLRQEELPADERAKAALLLADFGVHPAAAVLVEAARRSREPRLRLSALYALGRVGDAKVVPALKELLREGGSVAAYAADALRRLAARGVVEAQGAAQGISLPARSGSLPRPEP